MNPKELLEKLPLVRGWIDRTLAEQSNRASQWHLIAFPGLAVVIPASF